MFYLFFCENILLSPKKQKASAVHVLVVSTTFSWLCHLINVKDEQVKVCKKQAQLNCAKFMIITDQKNVDIKDYFLLFYNNFVQHGDYYIIFVN